MMPPRSAIWGLGVSQCVYWGIIYYAFSVLLVPMREEFHASNTAIVGAFSMGLGISALLAPHVGRWLDDGRGIALLRYGAWLGGVLLLAWSYVTSLTELYAVWVGLGVTMAAVLYETAFALVVRMIEQPQSRLSALAIVTVMGGLSSTIFVPIVGTVIAHEGWRTALRVLMVIWVAAAAYMEWRTLPALHAAESRLTLAAAPQRSRLPLGLIVLVGVPFVVGIFAAMALTTLVIPMLVDQGQPIDRAAWVLAALGIMQLPGRIWLGRGSTALPSSVLLVLPVILQATGLLLLAYAASLPIAFAGVGIFGLGAGLHTLARPWVVPQLFGVASAGEVNGIIARAQGIARAVGPALAALTYGQFGSTVVFSLLAVAMALTIVLATRASTQLAPSARAAIE
ncbi:MAG: hypothetical protein JSS16_02270 [Proteobacteria bacterium]|nr:hypothetical protein [Pseudomonadota bacterium]